MAFSFQSNHGAAISQASGTDLVLNLNTDIPAGRLVLVETCSDNEGAGATNLHSIADTQGHSWNKAGEISARPGAAANTGSTTALFWVVTTNNLVAGVDTITLTLASARVAKTIHCSSVSFTGSGVQLDDVATLATHSTSPSVASATLSNIARLWVACLGQDYGSDLALSQDPDYTTRISTTSNNAGGSTAVRCWLATRIAQITSDTYSVTKSTAADEGLILAAFSETGGTLTAGTAQEESHGTTTANLSASAPSGGTAPYTYQWHRSTSTGFSPDGTTAISGATSLTLADTGLTPATTYYYKLVQTDDVAASVTTNEVTVTTDPETLSGTAEIEGMDVHLLASPSGGVAPYSYQWHTDTTPGFTPDVGTEISSATTASYTHADQDQNVTRYYKCVVTDSDSPTPSTYTTPQVAAFASGGSGTVRRSRQLTRSR